MTLQQGQILINRYRIVNQIGQGGFGTVYRAWDIRMNGTCVIKENLDNAPELSSQFKHEAQILFQLKHSGLPTVHDYFEEPGKGQYLVMEYIEGQNLENIVAMGSSIPEEEAINWVSQVCDALEYLHNQNPPITHRYIKPQNIIITPKNQAILVDFGVAKVYRSHQKTTMGARAATPGYSPPEQYLQTGTDERSDIYSLGATLFTLLTGQVPPESIARSLDEELPDIHQFNPSISDTTCLAVNTAMAYKKKDRFSSVIEFRQVLNSLPSKPKKYAYNPNGSQIVQNFNVLAPTRIAINQKTLFKIKKLLSRKAIWLTFLGIVGIVFLIIDTSYLYEPKQTTNTSEIYATIDAINKPTLFHISTEQRVTQIAASWTLTPSITPTQTKTYTPTPTPIRAKLTDPQSCLHWSLISSSMIGNSVCVYGKIKSFYIAQPIILDLIPPYSMATSTTASTVINFSSQRHSFYIFSKDFVVPNIKIGDCIAIKGIIEGGNELTKKLDKYVAPHIEFGDLDYYYCEPWMEE